MPCAMRGCRHMATIQVDDAWYCEAPTRMRTKAGQVMSVAGGCAEVIRSRRPRAKKKLLGR